MGFKAGFFQNDEVLPQQLEELQRGHYSPLSSKYTDLKDAKTVLKDSGTAIMDPVLPVVLIEHKMPSLMPDSLPNDNKITGCKNVLLLIVSGNEEITIDEIGEINDFIQTEAGNNANIIMGIGEDEKLGSSVSVTIIATGFGADQQHQIVNTEAKKIIHTLEEDQTLEHNLMGSEDKSDAYEMPKEELVTEERIHEIKTELTLLLKKDLLYLNWMKNRRNPMRRICFPYPYWQKL